MNHEEYERMYRFEDKYWWFVARRNLIVSLIKNHYPCLASQNVAPDIRSSKTDADNRLQILDIGCGTGAMLDELAQFGNVVGGDYAVEALGFCRERGSGHPLVRTDARHLPFVEGSFDFATAMDIVEHIDSDKAIMSELYRVVKPGGRIFVTVPAYQSLWSEHDIALHHYRRYTAPMIKDLFQRVGFRVEKLTYTVSSLFPAAWTFRQYTRHFRKPDPNREPAADLIPVSDTMNKFLIKMLEAETNLLNKVNIPFGLTVACVARKEEN